MSADDMVLTTNDGQVFAVSLVDPDKQTGQVGTGCQQSSDMVQQHKWSSSLSAAKGMHMQHFVVADCLVECKPHVQQAEDNQS